MGPWDVVVAFAFSEFALQEYIDLPCTCTDSK